MIIYKCAISGDEMFSDSFKFTTSTNGIFYEVTARSTTRSDQFDESLISANASADEPQETCDSNSVSGFDIALNHHLVETTYDKKSYVAHIKGYVKALKANLEKTNPDRVATFVAEVEKEVKVITKNIKSYQFFVGESLCEEGMVVLLNYREDNITPYMMFFKDGLVEEKC